MECLQNEMKKKTEKTQIQYAVWNMSEQFLIIAFKFDQNVQSNVMNLLIKLYDLTESFHRQKTPHIVTNYKSTK